ncbi:transcription factor [Moniliophthora roreri]|nr:transcription factor [Moniliophthora roreri]
MICRDQCMIDDQRQFDPSSGPAVGPRANNSWAAAPATVSASMQRVMHKDMALPSDTQSTEARIEHFEALGSIETRTSIHNGLLPN